MFTITAVRTTVRALLFTAVAAAGLGLAADTAEARVIVRARPGKIVVRATPRVVVRTAPVRVVVKTAPAKKVWVKGHWVKLPGRRAVWVKGYWKKV